MKKSTEKISVKMTHTEAFEVLTALSYFCDECDNDADRRLAKELIDRINAAVDRCYEEQCGRSADLKEAIDEEIAELGKPKKVGHRRLRRYEMGSPWFCQECGADLVKIEFMSFDGGEPKNKVSYCWHCGTALDWGDDE